MNRLEQLAFSIADSAARSDVECYCKHVGYLQIDGEFINAFDIRYLYEGGLRELIDAALEYLELRGLIGRSEGAPHLVFLKPNHAQEGTTP